MTSEVTDEFVECETCKAKPGSPTLCPSCLHNRTVISRLRVELAKLRTLAFISPAKEQAMNEFQHALYRIAWLPFFAGWRAQQIAEEALGIGPYWCAGHRKGDWSPKTLIGYYLRRAFRAVTFRKWP